MQNLERGLPNSGVGLTFALHNRTGGTGVPLSLAWIMIAPLWRKCHMASEGLRSQRLLLRGMKSVTLLYSHLFKTGRRVLDTVLGHRVMGL